MEGRTEWPGIEYVEICTATEEHPRNDSASIVEFDDGELFMVWIQMHRSRLEGHDEAPSSIVSMRSPDGGRTWGQYRVEVTPQQGELSVYNPSLVVLPDGTLLFFYLTYHCLDYDKPLSSSGFIKRSHDNGRTWDIVNPLWRNRSFGCANDTFTMLSDGRLVKSVEDVPYRGHKPGAPGHLSSCFTSDDNGATWREPSDWVTLPLRGTMENHIAETDSGELVMSMRTQLGSVYISRSIDRGESWSHPQVSGLTAPESMSSLTRIPGTGHLLLIWNNAQYNHRHSHSGPRTPLTCSVSTDGARTWNHLEVIEDDPAIEFTNIGCTYTREGVAIITYLTSRVDDPAPPGRFGRHRMSLKGAIVPISRLYE
jgi:sialidase-1